MIGIQKQTKRFSLGTFFLVFFFAFFVHFNLDVRTVDAQAAAPSLSEAKTAQQAAAKNLSIQDRLIKGLPYTSPGGIAATFTKKSGVEFVSNIVTDAFKWFLYGVFTFCAFLAMLAAWIFSYVLDVSHLQAIMNNPIIYEMWRIVRDFFNLFFIFSLLLVAFSTIFQVSKYGGLKSVWNIVLAALFINFSFPIARMIIDVGNVMMYSLIVDIFSMSKDGLMSGVLSTSGLKGLFMLSENNLDFTVKYFLIAIVCMFMFGVSFLTLALMMFYRLFMLPILVMFAPIGFAGSAIPGMSGYSSQWWDKLIKNVFFGPIAVFMVMIAVQFMSALGRSQGNTITSSMVASSSANDDFLASIVYMTIPIIFFWIAITSAEKLSSEASGMANSFGSKFLKWTGGLPWRGTKEIGKWGGRKAESKLASMGGKWKYLSPSVVKKAFQEYAKVSEHEDMLPIEKAKAQVLNKLSQTLGKIDEKMGGRSPFHQTKTDYVFIEENKQKAHYEAEIKERCGGEPNEDQIRQFLREGYQEHNQAKVLAAVTLLSRINGLDNIAGDFAKELGTVVEGELGAGSIDLVESFDGTMTKMLTDLGMNGQSIAKHIHNFGENAKAKGDDAYGDRYTPDLQKGEWVKNTNHANTVAENFIKMKAQTRQDIQHARSLFTQSQIEVEVEVEENGKKVMKKVNKRAYGDMCKSGFAKAMKLNADDVKNVNRKNGVVDESIAAAVKGAKDNPNKYKKFIAAYNGNSNFKKYVDETTGVKGGYDFADVGGGSKKADSTYAKGVKAEDLKIV